MSTLFAQAFLTLKQSKVISLKRKATFIKIVSEIEDFNRPIISMQIFSKLDGQMIRKLLGFDNFKLWFYGGGHFQYLIGIYDIIINPYLICKI